MAQTQAYLSVHLKNHKGFTLLEVLISLAVLMIVAPLLSLIILTFYSAYESLDEQRNEEWEIFKIQFREENKYLQLKQVEDHVITFTDGEQEIRYARYSSYIRRTVGLEGHEIHLTNVNALRFQYQNGFVRMEVTFLDGRTYEAHFTFSPFES
ncbi:competence type IV pilus minor pilin ComGF [Jeotgalibacillus aurantiacus]|uniref:competence type IV pilus minor pilin ComGF n=1 Tax=Jeotgalibacillus aurantiacus TaxID=2763266 RepID=UPI001D09FE3A|nr:competence type IV pilus minor pilin ComGF [Jeotgalibacillus aurantiacus]